MYLSLYFYCLLSFDLNKFVEFTKNDEDQRIVEGYASTEAMDSQDEIVEKDASITNSLEGIESALIYAELLHICLCKSEGHDCVQNISEKIFYK
jgi:hypothetical protein